MTGPKIGANSPGAAALGGEQAHECHHRNRDDVMLEGGRGDVESLDRAQHRDRRGDHAVAVKQRGAEHPQADEQRAAAAGAGRALGKGQRHQCQDAPFTPVVRAQHDGQVFQRDDQQQRPEDQRQDAQDIRGRWRQRVRAAKALAQRIEGAGADVTIHNSQRSQGQKCQVAACGRLRFHNH